MSIYELLMIGSRPLEENEIKRVMELLPNSKYRLFFTFGLYTGFRVSELLSLRVSDVMKHGQLVDRVVVARKNMKGNRKSRSVVLHQQVKNALMTHLSGRADDWLFQSRQGGPIKRKQAWALLNGVFIQARLQGKLGTHCMRKTFASNMYHKLNKDLIATQKALDHVSINSTISYLSFNEKLIDEAILS